MVMNRQQRHYPRADPDEVGALIDRLGQPDDPVWTRTGNFPRLRLAGPLADYPAGGHGIIRYHVVGYQPGRQVTFRFEPEVGIEGLHRFEVEPSAGGGTTVRHTIEGGLRGSMRLAWPLAVRWLHERALVEVFDQIEASLAGETEPPPSRPSLWVRLLLRVGPSAEREEAQASAAA
jgi:hypothetical protein